jgi:GR25 family glycosyltransferase involved in LPS biosynthesis
MKTVKIIRLFFIFVLLLIVLFSIFYSYIKKEFFTDRVNIDYKVVHIRSYTDRYQNIIENETKLGQKIDIFDAVVGKNVDLNKLSGYHPQLQNNFQYKSMGEVGCYLSHFSIIKNINMKNGYTVVFEDDFMIVHPELHTKIIDIIHKLDDDFDIVFLGNLIENRDQLLVDDIYSVNKNTALWGTHAYLINNKKSETICNHLLNMDKAIDNKIHSLIINNSLKVYVMYPTLVNQKYGINENSTIQ